MHIYTSIETNGVTHICYSAVRTVRQMWLSSIAGPMGTLCQSRKPSHANKIPSDSPKNQRVCVCVSMCDQRVMCSGYIAKLLLHKQQWKIASSSGWGSSPRSSFYQKYSTCFCHKLSQHLMDNIILCIDYPISIVFNPLQQSITVAGLSLQIPGSESDISSCT